MGWVKVTNFLASRHKIALTIPDLAGIIPSPRRQRIARVVSTAISLPGAQKLVSAIWRLVSVSFCRSREKIARIVRPANLCRASEKIVTTIRSTNLCHRRQKISRTIVDDNFSPRAQKLVPTISTSNLCAGPQKISATISRTNLCGALHKTTPIISATNSCRSREKLPPAIPSAIFSPPWHKITGKRRTTIFTRHPQGLVEVISKIRGAIFCAGRLGLVAGGGPA